MSISLKKKMMIMMASGELRLQKHKFLGWLMSAEVQRTVVSMVGNSQLGQDDISRQNTQEWCCEIRLVDLFFYILIRVLNKSVPMIIVT